MLSPTRVRDSPPPTRATIDAQTRDLKAVQCDIFNVGTLTWFFKERVFSDLVLIGADGAQVCVCESL